MSQPGVVDKPLTLTRSLIPGSFSLSNETLKLWPHLHMALAVGGTLNETDPWPCLHMILAVGGTLNANSHKE